MYIMYKSEALCVMLLASYVCVSVRAHVFCFFLWSLLTSPATLKIRDETNFIGPGNSFCWVSPTYTQFPRSQDGHLFLQLIEYLASSQHPVLASELM